MCDHCSTHWRDLDTETGDYKRDKNQPVPPIPEKGCEECNRHFGWVIHRHYSKNNAIVQSGTAWAVGYWNEDKTMLTVLGWFPNITEAVLAEGHLAS
jgi:hypothetical protein